MSEDRSYTYNRTHGEYAPREVRRMVDALGLEDSVEKLALQVYEQAVDADFMTPQYLDVDVVASAAVFAACRLQGSGVSMDEMEGVSRENRRDISSAYRRLNRHLDLAIEPEDIEPYVHRFAEKLAVPEDSRELLLRLTRDAEEAGLARNIAPQSVAASLVYIVGLRDDLDITQADIRDEAGVSEKTVRVHYRDIASALDISLRPREGMDVETRRDEPPTAADATDRLMEWAPNLPERFWSVHTDVLNSLGRVEGKSDAGYIGGAFWVALQEVGSPEPIKQTDIAYQLGVSRATIQQRAREYREAYDGE